MTFSVIWWKVVCCKISILFYQILYNSWFKFDLTYFVVVLGIKWWSCRKRCTYLWINWSKFDWILKGLSEIETNQGCNWSRLQHLHLSCIPTKRSFQVVMLIPDQWIKPKNVPIWKVRCFLVTTKELPPLLDFDMSI